MRAHLAFCLALTLAAAPNGPLANPRVLAQSPTYAIDLSTGFDNGTGAVFSIPPAVNDADSAALDWEVIADPLNSALPRPATVVEKYGSPIGNPLNGWAQPFPDSLWVSGEPNRYASTGGTGLTQFQYDLSFNLPVGAFNRQIALRLRADNLIDSVMLGAVVLYPSATNPLAPPRGRHVGPSLDIVADDLNFPNLFLAGPNTLSVKFSNHTGTVTGLNVAGKVFYEMPPVIPCAPKPSGLVSWYPMDEQIGDGSVVDIELGLDGTPMPGSSVGAPNGPNAIPGQVQGALQFATGRWVEVPDSASHDFGAGPFAIDAWVKYSPTPASQTEPIVHKMSAGRGYFLYLGASVPGGPANQLHLQVGTTVFKGPIVSSSTAIGSWIFVAASRTGVGVPVKLYLGEAPGQLVESSSPPEPSFHIASSAANMLIGRWNSDPKAGLGIDELEIFNVAVPKPAFQAIFDAGASGKCRATATGDLGDAPDSTNYLGNMPMDAYLAVTAKYPTVFATNPPGPLHRQPMAVAWLGPSVSFENEADLAPDADGLTNIDPTLSPGSPDRDGFDDGLTLPGSMPACGPMQLTYQLSTAANLPTTTPLYVNVWLDYNRDGDWQDAQKCPLGPATTGLASEWAVQNQLIAAGSLPASLSTPSFTAANRFPGQDLWLRITLSDQPAQAPPGADPDGRGPAAGFAFGETEDYPWAKVGTGPAGEICGRKWNDSDGDGVLDPATESGLPGWTIQFADPSGNVIGTVTTGQDGYYCLTVTAGTYIVSELQQPGWIQTFPSGSGTHLVTVPPSTGSHDFGNRRVEPLRGCNLVVEKTTHPSWPQAGQPFAFVVKVRNLGLGACLPTTTVTDNLPSGFSVTGPLSPNSNDGWACSAPPNISCSSASLTLQSNQSSLVFSLIGTNVSGAEIENCAEVQNPVDGNVGDNRDCIRVASGPTVTPTPTATGSVTAIPKPPASPTAAPIEGAIANVSTRGQVGTGDRALIGGFIVSGGPVKLIIRAMGPSLTGRGVPGTLQDPTLTLHDAAGKPIALNDDWRAMPNPGELAAGLQPGDARESVIAMALEPGAYTAIVRGKDGTIGNALVEAFHAGGAGSLTNISTRIHVGQGDDVMIGGFIITGGAMKVAIRALGPSLTGRGVPGALQDPTLTLHDAAGKQIAFNDDWQTLPNPADLPAGLKPEDRRESVIVMTLDPGAYTGILRGKDGTTGIALVEVFKLR